MYQREAPLDTHSLSEESVCLVFISLLAVGALSSTPLNALFQSSADEGSTRIPPAVLWSEVVSDGTPIYSLA